MCYDAAGLTTVLHADVPAQGVAMTQVTDYSLLAMVQQGDQGAWNQFYEAYAPLICGYAKRLGLTDEAAADIVQRTFVAIDRALKQRPELSNPGRGRFRYWMRGVVRHTISRWRREQRKFVHGDQLIPADDWTAAEGIDDAFVEEWQRNLLRRALRCLAQEISPVAYQIFESYALRGEPAGRVAKLLGVTRNAVYVAKFKALASLRQIVAQLRAAEDRP